MPNKQDSIKTQWRQHSDSSLHFETVKNAVKDVNMSDVMAADINLEEKFTGAQRKQNLAHRSSLLDALDLAPFKNLDLTAQAAAVQKAASKTSRATVNAALSALDKRASQTFFKPKASTKANEEFNGVARKNNLRTMDAPDLDLSVLSEAAQARLETIKPTVTHSPRSKH